MTHSLGQLAGGLLTHSESIYIFCNSYITVSGLCPLALFESDVGCSKYWCNIAESDVGCSGTRVKYNM
jgi:hypothetical protein